MCLKVGIFRPSDLTQAVDQGGWKRWLEGVEGAILHEGRGSSTL